MPPNITGLSLVAHPCDEDSQPEITVYHAAGAPTEEGHPEWGYTTDEVDIAAFVSRTRDALTDYLGDGDWDPVTVAFVPEPGYYELTEDARAVLMAKYGRGELADQPLGALAEALHYELSHPPTWTEDARSWVLRLSEEVARKTRA